MTPTLKLTLSPTPTIVAVGNGPLCRLWTGKTPSGRDVCALVVTIGFAADLSAEEQALIESEIASAYITAAEAMPGYTCSDAEIVTLDHARRVPAPSVN